VSGTLRIAQTWFLNKTRAVHQLSLHTPVVSLRDVTASQGGPRPHREVVVYGKDVYGLHKARQVLHTHGLALRPQALQGTHFATEGAMAGGPAAEAAHH
jgi:hypothetical protein